MYEGLGGEVSVGKYKGSRSCSKVLGVQGGVVKYRWCRVVDETVDGVEGIWWYRGE